MHILYEVLLYATKNGYTFFYKSILRWTWAQKAVTQLRGGKGGIAPPKQDSCPQMPPKPKGQNALNFTVNASEFRVNQQVSSFEQEIDSPDILHAW